MQQNISFLFLLLFSFSSWAQDEGFLPIGNETATQVETDPVPPPVANPGTAAWENSAVANMLMEDGSFIPRRRSPWGAAFFNWSNINMKNYREGVGRLETYNYLSFDYRIDWKSKLSVRPEFYLSGAGRDFFGDDKPGSIEMGDVYLQYTHNEWALIPFPGGGLGLSGSLRAYYPNSENSKRQKQITRLQARMILQTPLGGGFWISYHFRPMYFVQSQKAYLNEFFNPKATENYRIEQRLELARPFGRSWAIHQEIATEHRWYYSSSANDINSERSDTYFGLSTAVSWYVYGVSLKGGINYESKLGTRNRNPNWYNEKDTTYFLMTSVRL